MVLCPATRGEVLVGSVAVTAEGVNWNVWHGESFRSGLRGPGGQVSLKGAMAGLQRRYRRAVARLEQRLEGIGAKLETMLERRD